MYNYTENSKTKYRDEQNAKNQILEMESNI